MTKPKTLKDGKIKPVNLEQRQIDFIKRKGINASKLMRQAVEAVRDGTLVYDYTDE